MCNKPDDINNQYHECGHLRNQFIDVLSDYDTLHYINLTKNQLMRICRCFSFGNEPIQLHCSQVHFIFCLVFLRRVLVSITYLYVISYLVVHPGVCQMRLNIFVYDII